MTSKIDRETWTAVINSIRRSTLVLTLFLFISCGPNTDPSNQKLSITGRPETVSQKNITQPKEHSLVAERFSKEFSFDTINYFDTKRNIEIVLVIPKSIEGNKNYDKTVLSTLNQERADFIARIDSMIKKDKSMARAVPSMFSIEPVSVFSDDKVVSYCFAVQKYNAGSAHPLFEYSSINYDKAKRRQFQFSDYYILKGKGDTTLLLNTLNAAINKPNIKLEKLYDLDFNIDNEYVSFNFDAYELGYGDISTRAFINKNKLISLVNEYYR